MLVKNIIGCIFFKDWNWIGYKKFEGFRIGNIVGMFKDILFFDSDY